MDRLDQKYPQWTEPVHGTTHTNGLRLSVSTTKKSIRPTVQRCLQKTRCAFLPLKADTRRSNVGDINVFLSALRRNFAYHPMSHRPLWISNFTKPSSRIFNR